jgi:hypothetical protein
MTTIKPAITYWNTLNPPAQTMASPAREWMMPHAILDVPGSPIGERPVPATPQALIKAPDTA